MKKSILVILVLLFTVIASNAQDDSLDFKSPTVKFLIKRGYVFRTKAQAKNIPDSLKKWPDVMYYNTIYKAKRMGSPTIPFSFTKIEYVNGEVEVSPTISIGYGYTWFTGDFMFTDYDKIIVNPKFFYGLIGNIGIQSNFSLKNLANIFMGGFIGIGSYSLFAGYDFIAHSPSIGLGARIDLYTIKQDFLKPFGKVHVLRRPKSFAIKIHYE